MYVCDEHPKTCIKVWDETQGFLHTPIGRRKFKVALKLEMERKNSAGKFGTNWLVDILFGSILPNGFMINDP